MRAAPLLGRRRLAAGFGWAQLAWAALLVLRLPLRLRSPLLLVVILNAAKDRAALAAPAGTTRNKTLCAQKKSATKVADRKTLLITQKSKR
jgi:hypothetical protein